MADESLDSVKLQRHLKEWRAGDKQAADKLLRAAGNRLEYLTRKMLRSFPNVRSTVETMDVLQSSVMRLLNSLRKLEPTSTRDFFNLAAVHIRRELLDLARRLRHSQPCSLDQLTNPEQQDSCPAAEPAIKQDDLELWVSFHEGVEQLATFDREVVSLIYYHGLSQQQVAEFLEVNERTIRRHWQSSLLELRAGLAER